MRILIALSSLHRTQFAWFPFPLLPLHLNKSRIVVTRSKEQTIKRRTEQNRTEQNRTEQNRTEQNRTEQSRAEQKRIEKNKRKEIKTNQQN